MADAPVLSPPQRLRAVLLGRAWALLLRLQRATWRTRIEGLDRLDASLAARRPLLMTFWHGEYVPLFALLRGRQAAVFTSASRRGAVIAEICRSFGYRAVFLPDRGREVAVGLMRRTAERWRAIGIALDGPLGPYHQVKAGPLLLAAELGLEVFPASVAASPRRVLAHRWDRMELPLLLSRVALVIAEPVTLPPELDEEGLARWKGRLRDNLDQAGFRASELLAR